MSAARELLPIYAATSWTCCCKQWDGRKAIKALAVNQFPKVTIIETGETMDTTNADEFVLTGTLPGNAIVTARFECGKRNSCGVQTDISGTEGDLRVTNTSAFGDIGDNYLVFGARGNKLALEPMPVPSKYDVLPKAGLRFAITEAAENFAALAMYVKEPALHRHSATRFACIG